MEKMTAQEIFDRVALHLRTMPEQSTIVRQNTTLCAYRAPDGNRCAIGALISDAKYSPKMENLRVYELADFEGMEGIRAHSRILTMLQIIHDNNDNWGGDMLHRLTSVASEYDLDASILDIFN